MIPRAISLWDSPAQFVGDLLGAVSLFAFVYGAMFMVGVMA